MMPASLLKTVRTELNGPLISTLDYWSVGLLERAFLSYRHEIPVALFHYRDYFVD